MKKTFISALAVAILLSASCQREGLEPTGGNTVTYTVEVPGAMSTKAIGDDVSGIDKLYYEVYREAEVEDMTKEPVYEGSATFENGLAKLPLEFVKNQKFVVLFWAQSEEADMYGIDDLRNVTLKTKLISNNEAAAAFAGSDRVDNCISAVGGNVSLSRPIAQLNIATTKESLLIGGKTTVAIEKSAVTVKGLYASYNVYTEETGAGDVTDFVYESAAAPAGDIAITVDKATGETVDYKYVAMNYVGFAPKTSASVDVDFTITTSEGDITHTVSSVPVKPNYRTNIIGNLITGTSDYIVDLEAEWGTPAEIVEIWDGKAKYEPAVENGKYVIKKASEFAWLEAPQSLEYDVVLAADIDMGGNKFMGILSNGKQFDGAGHTLKNVKLDYTVAGQEWSSLFVTGGGNGPNSNINVKDLTVDGAHVFAAEADNGNAAVIASYAEATVNIENVKVRNCTVNGTQSIGSLVGHVAQGMTAIKNCEVDNVTLSTFDVTGESGNVGGVVGRVTAECTIENTSISNSVINAYVNAGSMTEQKRTISKYVGNFYGGSASLVVTDGYIDNVTINQLNELAKTQSCLYTEYLGGWREEGGSVSINGIEITKEQTNEDITINTSAELATAISEAADGAVIPVSGKISTTALSASKGNNITIVGMSEDATVDVVSDGDYTDCQGNITFKNLTIKMAGNRDHYSVGLHNNGGEHIYENCKFEGLTTAWGDCTYNNCEFVNTVEGKYAAWVYLGTVVYNNCTFTGVNRAAKVFNENSESNMNVIYNDCKFIASGTNKDKTGVEVAVMNNTNVATVVTINNPEVVNMKNAEHFGTQVFNIEYKYDDNSKLGNGIVTVDGDTYACVSKGEPLLKVLQMNSKSLTVRTIAGIDCYLSTGIGGADTQEINIESTSKDNLLNITCSSASYNGSYCTFRAVNPNAMMKFSNIALDKSAKTENTWNTYNMEFYTDVVLENCNVYRPITVCTNAIISNTTIDTTNDTANTFYSIWQQANGTSLTLNECVIKGNRGIKIDNEYVVAAPSKLFVNNTSFVTTGSKSAILVKSAAKVDIELSEVNIDEVAADKINPVWVDADAKDYFDLVTVTGGTKVQE